VLAFWPEIVRPLLATLRPRAIVEIGSESGKTTKRLLELAASIDAVVHAVDPAPTFDADVWEREHAGRLVMHRLPSLVALPSLGPMDAVLIDGDHNWYTVFHELQLIERCAEELGQPQPLVLLHDVSWPYGRRDLYYDPSTIPAEHRQPYARRGISPTSSELLPTGGYNAHLCNALVEGGPKNGVLTAVEDYLAQSGQRFVRARVPAVFGLAILLPRALAEKQPELAAQVGRWAVPEVEKFIDRLELARIAMLTR
jgi:hypothetical protein